MAVGVSVATAGEGEGAWAGDVSSGCDVTVGLADPPAGANGKGLNSVGLTVGLVDDVVGASIPVEAPGNDSGAGSRQATNSSNSETAMRVLATWQRIVLKSFLLVLIEKLDRSGTDAHWLP